MLRPHTFAQLRVKSFVLVTKRKSRIKLGQENIADLLHDQDMSQMLGYYFEFKSKTMAVARAYFPNISKPESYYSAMCPVKAMESLAYKG